MRIITFMLILGMANVANASWFSKAKPVADAEGNCLPEVINGNATLYGELETLKKIADRSKEEWKKSPQAGAKGFKELTAKAKNVRAAIKKFGDTYTNDPCNAIVNKKTTVFTLKQGLTSYEKVAGEYEHMAEVYLQSLAKK